MFRRHHSGGRRPFQRRFQYGHRNGFGGVGRAAGAQRFDRGGRVARMPVVPERHVLVELGHFVGGTAGVLVPAPFEEAERRRTKAQHYADRATAHADGNHAGPDEPELDRLEALLAGAHERYDQAQRH